MGEQATMARILDGIRGPLDLKSLDDASLKTLAQEIRGRLSWAPVFVICSGRPPPTATRHSRDRSGLVERQIRTRLHFLIRRVAGISRLRKLAWATGAAIPAWLAYVVTRPRGFGEAVALS